MLSLKMDNYKDAELKVVINIIKMGKEHIYLNIFEAGWAKKVKPSCRGLADVPCETALGSDAEGR